MASLGSSSLPLSLRPWPGQKAEHDQLQFTIGRMQLEHGGFRQITEDALIQEIADAKNGDKPADEQSAEAHAPQVGDVKGEKGTKEYIIAMKAKMMQNLGCV
jgi:hypothetical protein